MRAITFLYLWILCGLFSFQSDDNRIVWNENRKLTWDDFKGKPDPSIHAEALTMSDIKVSAASGASGSITVDVSNYFDKNLSWKKSSTSKQLLAHEQLHFDITELYTRKLREKLSSIATVQNMKSGKFNKESSKLLNEWQQFQQQYDKETAHGTITAEQLRWQSTVAALLKGLDQWKTK